MARMEIKKEYLDDLKDLNKLGNKVKRERVANDTVAAEQSLIQFEAKRALFEVAWKEMLTDEYAERRHGKNGMVKGDSLAEIKRLYDNVSSRYAKARRKEQEDNQTLEFERKFNLASTDVDDNQIDGLSKRCYSDCFKYNTPSRNRIIRDTGLTLAQIFILQNETGLVADPAVTKEDVDSDDTAIKHIKPMSARRYSKCFTTTLPSTPTREYVSSMTGLTLKQIYLLQKRTGLSPIPAVGKTEANADERKRWVAGDIY